MPVSGEQIDRFLETLPEGFTYGIHERLAVNQLILRLAERGEFPEDPRALKTLLAPLVCSSPDQQRELYERLDREWKTEPPPAVASLPEKIDARRAPWWLAAEAIVLMLGVGAGALMGVKWIKTPVQTLETPAPLLPKAPEVVARTTATISGRVFSEAGNPIAGAEVWIPGQIQSTRPDGSFSFASPAASGSTPILVAHPDYRSKMASAAPRTSALEIKLQPLTTLLAAGDLTPAGEEQSFRLSGPTSAVINPSGDIVAIHGRRRTFVWNLTTRQELSASASDFPSPNYVEFHHVDSPDNRYSVFENSLLEPGLFQEHKVIFSFPNALADAQFDRSSRYVAVRTSTGEADVYDAATGQRLNRSPGWPRNVIGLRFSRANSETTRRGADGETWKPQSSGTANDLWSVYGTGDGKSLWVAGNKGAILHSTDGETWQPQSSGTTDDLRSVYGTGDGKNLWAVGVNGTILHSTDGQTWREQSSGTTNVLWSMYGTGDGKNLWVVGAGGTILHSADGETWKPQSSGTVNPLWAVYGTGDGKSLWAAGDKGTILHSTDGRAWKPQSSGASNVTSVYGTGDGKNLWAAGDKGAILHSTDGQIWEPQSSGTSADLLSVYGTSDGRALWVVGRNGTILYSADGQTWKPQLSGTANQLSWVYGTADGKSLWAVGDGGTILHGTGGGAQSSGTTTGRLAIAAVDRTLSERVSRWCWLIAILPAAVLGLWLYWIYRTRARLRRLSLPADLDTYTLKAPRAEPPFRELRVRRLALEMRRRKPASSLDLAPEPTIHATVRRAGFLTPVYAARTLQREFLILVQKAETADQQARLYQTLAEALRLQGTLVDFYTFRGSPERIRDPQTGGWLDIEELAARHPHHDLWIVADPADFPDPFSLDMPRWISALSRWQDRAVLSPAAVDPRLRALLEAEGVRVGVASIDGLMAMLQVTESDRIPRLGQTPPYPEALRQLPLSWVERSSPGDAAIAALLPELEACLGEDGMLLAGACSVYPETFWPLTLWLANRLIRDAARRDAALMRLTALPWFRYGRIPDWMRVQLVNRLGPHSEPVRQAVEEFLAKAERADRARGGDMAISREERGAKGELRDYVMFSFLLGRKVDAKLAVKPPSAWLRLLFEGGQFVFGPRLWIYGAAAIVFGVIAWFASTAALVLVPSRVVLTQWKLPEPTQAPPPRTFPDNPLRRAILEVADSMVGQSAASEPEEKVVAQAMRFLDGDRGASRPVDVAAPVPGVAFDGGFVESVSGNRATVIESQNGSIQRLERALPAGPFRDYLHVNSIDGLTYMWIPAGQFMMGCSPGDNECRPEEKPAHQVAITKGLWMGQTEVTQEAYQKVTGTNPSHLKAPKLPVGGVTWDEAAAYCKAINSRLPTEAEWEYAARAGTTQSRYGAADQIAWELENSGDKPHEVGQKQPNAWGLYDTLGNVGEWTADWYDEKYPASAQADPRSPASGAERTVRGGNFANNSAYIRASIRGRLAPGNHGDNLGFRCAQNNLPQIPLVQAPPPQAQPGPQPAVSLGMTPDQVTAVLGRPNTITDLGSKTIYVYPNLKVTFTDGKVSDLQ